MLQHVKFQKILSICFAPKKQLTTNVCSSLKGNVITIEDYGSRYQHCDSATSNYVKIFVFICLCFCANISQAQWTLLNSGTTQNLNEIFFPVADTGFVVGDKGIVLKTTNGGLNWQNLNTNLTLNLHDLFFLDAQEGWIVGDSGTVCHTTNGGTSWECNFLDSAANVNLHSVYAINRSDILVGGNRIESNNSIFKSINGGSSWQQTTVESYIWTVDILKIGMISNSTGYAISRGLVFKTTNAGLNWYITDTASVRANSMFSILEDIAYFPGKDTLFVCGWYPGYFGKTTNGALNWSHDASQDYTNLDFISPLVGYVGGWGVIRKTTDGGLTFVDASGGSAILFNSISSIDFTDEWTGYACGTQGKIIKTSNGGATGIKDYTNLESSITMYPNPTSGQIHFSTQTNVEITNLTGQIVAKVKNVNAMNLSDKPAGIYFIKFTDIDGNLLQLSKIAKE